MAKISKLLLAMEKGSLGRFQGKSLDEIEIEDELDPETIGEEDPDDDDDDGDDDGDGEKSHPVLGLRGKRKTMTSSQDETKNSKGKRSHLETREVRRRYIKKSWSKMEVSAVMKHFKAHILKGHLATKMECEQCKLAEDHILKGRTVQNIRDFVRNRGRMSTKGNLV
ncbi:helicase ARIP4-like isoform X2 [Pungitius pungitius]